MLCFLSVMLETPGSSLKKECQQYQRKQFHEMNFVFRAWKMMNELVLHINNSMKYIID